MASSRRIFLVTLLGVAALFALVVGLTNRLGTARASNEQRVANALKDYQAKGYFVDDVLEEGDYVVPNSIPFRSGMTEQEFEQFVKEHDLKRGPDHVDAGAYLKLLIKQLTDGTQYEGKWQVNALPKDGWLNVYFLSKDPHQISEHFTNNCAYVGYQNAIICDARFIKDLLRQISEPQEYYVLRLNGHRPSAEEAEKYNLGRLMRANFLYWLLGHEIGHAVLHRDRVLDGGTTAHFHEADYNEVEKEADLFVCQRGLKSQDWATPFLLCMSEYVEREYRKNLRPSDSGRVAELERAGKTEVAAEIPIEVTETHEVPLFVRMVNMLDNLTASNPILDGTGHHSKVKENITLRHRSSEVEALGVAAFLLFAGVSVVAYFGRQRA